MGLAKNVAYSLTHPSSQATKLHPGKAKSYELKALNETMLPMRRKKSITIYTTSTRPHQFPPPFQPKRKNEDLRKRGDSHQEQEKVKKEKNRRKVKRKQIN